MALVTRTQALCIYDWMLDLGLTDKQQKLYAIIYGYSQNGLSRMVATSESIAKWLNCTQRQAKNIIRQLEDMGLVAHDVVSWSNGEIGGVRSEFWAILPEDATRPEKGEKKKISWRGREINFPTGRETNFPTPHKSIKPTKINTCGGSKKYTRSRAKGTTTTGFLFENNGSGLAAGESLKLPYTEIYFREAWERLLRQPAWAAKTPGALELELQTLADVADAIIAAYCCDLAVKKGWDTIKDPGKVYADDIEQVEAYGEICHAKERRAEK